MLRIRLRRVGRKNEPHYQLVVAPHTNAVKSSVTAKLGWYDPKTKKISFDKEQLMKWLNEGAQPSNTVAKILLANKVEHKLIKFVPDAPGKPRKKSQAKVKSAPKADEAAAEATDESVSTEEATADNSSEDNAEPKESESDANTDAAEPTTEDESAETEEVK